MKLLICVFLGVLGLAIAQQCDPGEFTCDNGRCIPDYWVCDGDGDCGDGSDERECPCDGFKCNMTGACLPDQWVCDGDNDCDDWSDETDCPNCDGIECGRICIPARRICDGRDDCEDGSDERWEPGMPGFSCNSTGRCIPDSAVCDGRDDCEDGSDEIWVPGMPGFACPGTGRCITESRKCDRNDDCGDGSDESEETCPCAGDNDMRCAPPPNSNLPGECIPAEWVCDEDGIWDCPDGSDEANCDAAIMKRARTHPKVTKKVAVHHKNVKTSPARRNSLLSLIKRGKANNKAEERRQRKVQQLSKH